MLPIKDYYDQMRMGIYDGIASIYNEDSSCIFMRNENGDTLLHFAVEEENVEISRWLLEHGSYAFIYNLDGISPVSQSVMKDNVEILIMMLNKHKYSLTKYDKAEILGMAAASGARSCLEYLLKSGYDSNMYYRENPIIYWANQSEDVSIVNMLCDYGADVNLPNEEGMTALYDSSASGLYEITECLLEHGADVNKSTADNITPLSIACCYGHCEIVKLLLKNKANMEIIDESGETALLHAIQYGNLEIVKVLLSENADVKVKDKYGNGVYDCVKKVSNKEIQREIIEMVKCSSGS